LNDDPITQWLDRAREGDGHAAAQVWQSVYQQVRRVAQAALANEHGELSVQATELAHEAYLKLAGSDRIDATNRHHLMATVARAIRHLLVDRARSRKAIKRGGGTNDQPAAHRVALADDHPQPVVIDDRLVDLHEALEAFAVDYPRQAQLIELRWFAGFTLDEAADIAGVSRRTAAGDWAMARAWIRRWFQRHGDGGIEE
jgi:RNA polymerase sigma-70 factor, ECF subfamily